MERAFKVFRNRELTSSEKLILVLFLADNQLLRESNRTIGRASNISGVTVSNSIKTLAEKGFITVTYNSSGIRRDITLNEDRV